MKFTSAAAAAILAACVSASPTPTVEGVLDARVIAKRATITDAANIGYAQQNGGYDTTQDTRKQFVTDPRAVPRVAQVVLPRRSQASLPSLRPLKLTERLSLS